MSHPNLIFTNKWDIQHLLFFLSFRYFGAILYKPDFQQCWVMFTHSNHTILQVILYKLCSRTYLWAFQPYTLPILSSQLNSAVEIHPNLVSHPYLISRNKSDVNHFLFFLTLRYHWEILYETHCQQWWGKITHAGHVILQLILYKFYSKMSLLAFQPYELPILTSQLFPAKRKTFIFGGTHLSYM